MTATQTAGTAAAQGEAACSGSGHQPITEFWFEIPPTQDEVRARLTAAENAAHAQHVEPAPFCYLCPRMSRNPERAR